MNGRACISRRRSGCSIRGLSLIEVTIAMAILLTVLSTMFGVFTQGARRMTGSRSRLAAYSICRSYLERYYDWPALDALDGVTDGVVTNGVYNVSTDAEDFADITQSLFGMDETFAVNLTIASGPVNGARLKRVTAGVDWGEGAFNLSMFKAQY